MCGIIGFFLNRNKSVSESELFNSTNLLLHRGPDDCGIYVDKINRIFLGHRRLSIVDLSSEGHQPITDGNGRYTIVFNGEVYNYREIKENLEECGFKFKSESDTEVILSAYIYWGPKCLSRFRGMFALAIFDNNPEYPKLFLARDRFGIKPLIYSRNSDGFFFASELNPLVNSGLIKKEVNYEGLSQYFSTGSILQPNTIFKNLFFLEPGHYMEVDAKQNITIKRWYNLPEEVKKLEIKYENSEYGELTLLTKNLLQEATKYHLVADVEIGAFLSGGVDSSSIVALMNQLSENKIKTFSIGFDEQSEVIDEGEDARAVADFIGTDHYGVAIGDDKVRETFKKYILALDQPSIDGINTYFVSEYASEKVKVALSGLGGDEIFAGYEHFFKIKKFSEKSFWGLEKIMYILYTLFPNILTVNFYYFNRLPYFSAKEFRNYNHYNKLRKIINPKFLKKNEIVNGSFDKTFQIEKLSAFGQIGLAEIEGYLLSTLLRDCDVLSMAHSLEVRPVLLDHKLVEHALSLPDSAKMKDGRGKKIFIDAVRDIIPEDCWKRKKTGFGMPFGTWMNGPLNNIVSECFSSDNAKIIFKPNTLKHFQHQINKKTISPSMWIWLILIAWLNENNIILR